MSTLIDVPAGAVLARQGSTAREFVIVLTGAATVVSDGRTTSGLLAGDHFGAIELLDRGANPATIFAETPMRLAVVGRAAFPALLDASPVLARTVLSSLASRVRAAA